MGVLDDLMVAARPLNASAGPQISVGDATDAAGWHSAYNHASTNKDWQQVAQAVLLPPGDCTWGQHRRLQDDVDQACKGPTRRCTQNDSLADVDRKIELNAQCIAARNRINNACFRGGDPTHQQAVAQEQRALQNCHEVKAALEAKAAKQNENNSTMAWLAGGAAAGGTLYWIISEGSRLFPLRNLVPVP